MPVTRIYQAQPLKPAMKLHLDAGASHHLAHVLRAKVGMPLVLFNGQGGEFAARISSITKRQVEVEVLTFSPREAESPLTICLAQGMARGEKMDFIIQKAVELGVKQIVPLVTERANLSLKGEREAKRLQHWRAVSISACEQSGRNQLPQIVAPMSLKEWLPTVTARGRFVLTPHSANQLPHESLPPAAIVLLVGPEGGFSEEEVAAAMEYDFLPWRMGLRVLRTETAGMAAISILQYQYGDF